MSITTKRLTVPLSQVTPLASTDIPRGKVTIQKWNGERVAVSLAANPGESTQHTLKRLRQFEVDMSHKTKKNSRKMYLYHIFVTNSPLVGSFFTDTLCEVIDDPNPIADLEPPNTVNYQMPELVK